MPPQLLCLGPSLPELLAWQPDLPAPWQFLNVHRDGRLLPWEMAQTETQGISTIEWGGLASKPDSQLFLLHLLKQLNWQAIWVTEPEYAFLAVFAARLSGKPTFLKWPVNPHTAVFSPAEAQWLLENAEVIRADLETDSDFHRPFPIAPHLGIVYTKFVSETDI